MSYRRKVAVLKRQDDIDYYLPLAAWHLVGRSKGCLLRIEDPQVSSEHARLQWRGAVWELRDLGSLNGTYVNGQPIKAGERVVLEQGDVVSFAKTGNWELVDASAPGIMAVQIDDNGSVGSQNGLVVCAEGGVLALPPEVSCPEVSVYQRSNGDWIAERDDQMEVVRDQHSLSAGGRIWRLHLPDTAAATVKVFQGLPSIESIELHFAVSRDQEHVELSVNLGDRLERRKPRAHHFPLLELARARLRDQSDQTLTAGEQGWLYQDELVRGLGTSDSRLNQDIYRARREFDALGIVGAARIVERRSMTRQLRLGVGKVEIATI